MMVADDTEIHLFTDKGEIPMIHWTEKGYFNAVFTSGSEIGTALITAMAENGTTASTEIEISNAMPDRIVLSTSATYLPPDGISTAQLVATVRDQWGNYVPNQTVRIGG